MYYIHSKFIERSDALWKDDRKAHYRLVLFSIEELSLMALSMAAIEGAQPFIDLLLREHSRYSVQNLNTVNEAV